MPFLVGDHVVVDGNEIKGLVVQISLRLNYISYEVTWWHNGQAMSGWFEDWRLSLATDE